MSVLFKIGNNDYTNRITVPSYNVNDKPIYTSWTDSNWLEHRDIHRWRAEGRFTLKFFSQSEFTSFMSDVETNRQTDGTVVVTLYLNNKNTTASRNVFLDFEADNTLPYIGLKEYDGFEVTVTER